MKARLLRFCANWTRPLEPRKDEALDAALLVGTASVPRRRGGGRALNEAVRIAIDAMGGDHGPGSDPPGCRPRARRPHKDMRFLFFGDEKRMRPILDGLPRLAAVSVLRHTDVAVKMDDRPSQALRAGRRTSSMWLAIDAVKKGEADVAFFGRQYRRIDGHVENLSAHDGAYRASGDCRDLADHARPVDRSRRRRDDRRPMRSISSISRSWAPPWPASSSMCRGRPLGY